MAYARTRLGRWFYEERGHAARAGDAAIVLLHGLLFDGGMWNAQLEPLAALGRVVVLDGPGHGKSNSTPPHFSIEDHADALAEALSELRVERAIVVGLSWGGMVGLRFALQHPSRVRALALLGTGADREAPSVSRKYRVLEEVARRFGFPSWIMKKMLAPILFGPTTLRERPEMIERLARRANGFSRNGMARAGQSVLIERTRVLERLAEITAPTLVVCGTEDRTTPPAESEAIAVRIAGAKLVLIEAAGHTSALERPDAVNAALVPFVRQHVGA